MVKRVALVILGSLIMTMLLATAAFAWTPQDILEDYMDNQALDRDYTREELLDYLGSPVVEQYAAPLVTELLNDEVQGLVDRDVFPFTGFQMMIAGIVVVVLVGGGVLLRMFSRPRKSSQSS